MPSAEPHDHDLEVIEVAQEGGRDHERLEALRVPDVARVHDDQLAGEALATGPLVVPGLRSQNGRIDPVRDDIDSIRSSAFLDKTFFHLLADGDDSVRAL